MFKSVHEALEFAYREIENEVTGMGNTASIIRWIETKGAGGGSSNDKATSTDRHGDAVLIIQRVERLLESYPLLLSSVRCQFGRGGQYYHMALMTLEQHYATTIGRSEPYSFGYRYLLHNIYTSTPSFRTMKDSGVLHDLGVGRSEFYELKSRVRNEINGWMAEAVCLLSADFMENDILFKEVA